MTLCSRTRSAVRSTPASSHGYTARRARPIGISLRFHDLRHAWASAAPRAGVPLLVVSRHLGHADVRTTADTYGQVDTDVRPSPPAIPSGLERLKIAFARKPTLDHGVGFSGDSVGSAIEGDEVAIDGGRHLPISTLDLLGIDLIHR